MKVRKKLWRRPTFWIALMAAISLGSILFLVDSDEQTCKFLNPFGPRVERKRTQALGGPPTTFTSQYLMFTQSPQEIYTVMKSHLVKERKWSEEGEQSWITFTNPKDLNEFFTLYFKMNKSNRGQFKTSLLYAREASTFESIRHKLFGKIGY